MVGEATPLALANLRRLSQWCDLILTEATLTFQGRPRLPLRAGWRDLLGLSAEQLRIYTVDPPQASGARLQAIQRNGVLPALLRQPLDRPVLLADADELLDPQLVLEWLAGGIRQPGRLGLVPLYAAIDREAPGSHCCWKPEWAELRRAPPRQPFLFPGPVLVSVAMLQEQSPNDLRRTAPFVDHSRSFGVHATLAAPIPEVMRKLRSSRHVWMPRILDPLHLNTMLTAGVHHAGWWIAAERRPEPWLQALAADCGLRLAGPAQARQQLAALRAWAEARLDPALPDALVREIDAYVASRAAEADDFLSGLDDWLCVRPVSHWGHAVGQHLAGLPLSASLEEQLLSKPSCGESC